MTDYFYQNRRIGSLKDGIFRKRVQKSKHLMRMYDAWGIQYDAVKKLRDEGCVEIRIKDTEDDRVYSTSFDTLFKKGRVEQFGDGMQVFLPRSEWNTNPNINV